ncbi:TonB-dependent receptor [Horticoccus sp. 23ND18S-11]|uniref:TonB-dependent receptor n=1 Tax=Horticoccus sp. 23ND18S-11 TaxID=3391832 RepID=UPI0039C8D57C
MLSPHVSAPLAVAALCGTIVSGATTPVAAPAEKRAFNLPRGDAAVTLKQFAAAAGTPIVYLVDRVRGTTTNAVSGEFTPREALERMLAGSALEAAQDAATGALVVSRKRVAEVVPQKGEVGPVSDPQPQPKATPMKSARTLFAALVSVLLAPHLDAQAGASANPAARPAETVIVLSPFQVASDADRGYQALNTLSGTRLNSKLEDLGSSITVVTKQQMTDLGMLDINDVFRYEASTEGTDNFTQFVRDRTGGIGDQVQSNPQQSNRIRGLGAAGTSGLGVNTAFGNFATNNAIPFDPYNIAAIEVSRGPNSNLFGLGAAAGTVNVVPTQANLERRSYSADLRFDSYGGHRESLNINTPLLPGKLALRIAGVNESKGFVRKPSAERIHREFATLLARPFRNTTIRATAERYRNDYRRPNSITPRDTTTEWKAGGSPTWDPTTQMVTFANGTKAGPFASDNAAAITVAPGVTTALSAFPAGLIGGYNGFYSRPMVIVDNNRIQEFTITKTNNAVTGTTLPTNPFNGGNSTLRYLQTGTDIMRRFSVLGSQGLPLYIVPGTTDRSVYDWTSYNFVAPNHGTDRAKTYSTEIEQIILSNPTHLLAARIGGFQQKYSKDDYTLVNTLESVIYVDVNEKRLDGTPNPYFKRPYVQAAAPSARFVPNDVSILSADLAYQLTPSQQPKWLKWIGQQRFGAHAEQNFTDAQSFQRVTRAIDTNKAWINPTAALNLSGGQFPSQRWYVGDNQGQNVDYGTPATDNIIGTYPLTWFNNRTGTWINDPVTMRELTNTGQGARTRTEVRTFNVTAQSFFLKNRLVTTVGWRRDRQRVRTGASVFVNPATGLPDESNLNLFGPLVNYFPAAGGGPISRVGWEEQAGDTKTYGAVIKALSWLNFHINKSDSFAPQPVLTRVDRIGSVPNPHGYATEWGVSVTALQGKLNVRLNRYQTKELNSRGSEVGTLGNRYLDMEGIPDGSNRIQVSSFRYFATEIARGRLAAQGIANPTAAQLDPAVATLMGISNEMYTRMVYSGASQPRTVGTTNVSSKGFELEATYNPTRNWRMKFTGAQTRAQDDSVSPEIFDWWQARLPVWTSLRSDVVPGDGKGRLWWDTVPADYVVGGETRTPQTRWLTDQYGAFLAAATNVGRPRTQIREFRFTGITNYTFSEGRLKDFNLGGAVRWESKASIGFLAGAPETSGVFQGAVLFLDTNKPVWDKARAYVDLSAGYRLKLWGDKVRTKVQLNVKNAFEGGRLQPIAINPDGTPYAYRIIDPRQFILSASFEL